ncbi:MAG TPA: type II toxin-antitoxin system VapC family toxin [Thermoanaerobaculia bacterium]|nr:type II toxin-antitoxin system VapC family toxin [Thermoanaerobaculia bacterium]
MAASLILETTFLVDLERERRRSELGFANRFLERHTEDRLFLTFTVAGELAAGASLSERGGWEAFLAPFHALPSTLEVCWRYGRAYRHLERNGLLIGTNDLWIAATALAYGMPVVTANLDHFRRVPELEVLRYRD